MKRISIIVFTALLVCGSSLGCSDDTTDETTSLQPDTGASSDTGESSDGEASADGSVSADGSASADAGDESGPCDEVTCSGHGTCVEHDGTPACECDEGYDADGLECVGAVELLFYDSFESGDMSTTNEDGFSWGRNDRTSIVTAERVVWNNGTRDVDIPEGRDWTPKHGEHSLRFRYAPLKAQAEQRFSLGKGYPEIWFRYWIRIPHNFIHENPTGSSANNKWFALWMDDYSQHGEGQTIVWNFWPQDDASSRFTYSLSNTPSGPAGHHAEYRDFIRYPEDQGRWMQVVLYAKISSSPEASDGETKIWRRWEGEAEYTLISESVGRNFVPPESGPQGWGGGYIMGWSNSGYEENTEFLVDEFTVSTTSLLN